MQKTIKTLIFIAIAMVMSVFAQAETLSPQKGVVRIKLQSEVATQVGTREVKALNGRLSTGVRTLDAVNRRVKAVRMRRVFPYSEKFESKMAAYGLDRWYEVTFDETMNPRR